MSKSTMVFIVAIIFIPAAVFSVAYYFSETLKSDISLLVSNIEKIESAMSDNSEEANNKVAEFMNVFNKEWEKRSMRWCFFFDHEAIHQIDLMRAELEAEVIIGEYNAATITLTGIKRAFEMLSEHDSLNVSNFF